MCALQQVLFTCTCVLLQASCNVRTSGSGVCWGWVSGRPSRRRRHHQSMARRLGCCWNKLYDQCCGKKSNVATEPATVSHRPKAKKWKRKPCIPMTVSKFGPPFGEKEFDGDILRHTRVLLARSKSLEDFYFTFYFTFLMPLRITNHQCSTRIFQLYQTGMFSAYCWSFPSSCPSWWLYGSWWGTCPGAAWPTAAATGGRTTWWARDNCWTWP